MNSSRKWDLVPVYGVYMVAPGDTPVTGRVEFKVSQRVTSTNGRLIYPDGAKRVVTIGAADEQVATVRAAVRAAWRAADEAADGDAFDGAAWDVWWDTQVLPAAVFTEFPASDDPDILQHGWQVMVSEALTSANGRSYAIQPLLAHLDQPIPGVNLGTVDVPPGSPTVPAPVYAKGIAGGVAGLDADGDVVDAAGRKVIGGGGGSAGKSAYQLAVEGGFVGTQSAWLTSLRGIDGAPGESVLVVRHGAVAGTPRPDTAAPVFWVGTVAPTNRGPDDLYLVTGAATTPEPAFAGAFDTFTAPHRAHSLRRVLGSYSGPLVRVRRSSDGAEADIPATASGDLSNAALLAHVGSGDGFVTAWYDQSGSGRDMAQPTVAAQPRIVTAGVVEVLSGKPCVVFDGTDDHLISAAAGLYAAGAATIATVFSGASNANSVLFSEIRRDTANDHYRLIRSSTQAWNMQATAGATSVYAVTATGSVLFNGAAHHAFGTDTGSQLFSWIDDVAAHNAAAAARAAAVPNPTGSVMGAALYTTASNFLAGRVQEVVTWAGDQRASRAGIRAAQQPYWGTP